MDTKERNIRLATESAIGVNVLYWAVVVVATMLDIEMSNIVILNLVIHICVCFGLHKMCDDEARMDYNGRFFTFGLSVGFFMCIILQVIFAVTDSLSETFTMIIYAPIEIWIYAHILAGRGIYWVSRNMNQNSYQEERGGHTLYLFVFLLLAIGLAFLDIYLLHL